MNDLLKIDPAKEKERIVTFLQDTFSEQKINKAVIGLSAGIDSTTSFYLLKEVLAPEDIIVANLYYFQPDFDHLGSILKQAKIPQKNIQLLSIKKSVDTVSEMLVLENDEDKALRIGNIAARMRMIVLFDLAKKYRALVCGTENKSENLLGYFTRFGDQASDIEPLEHLYKTQVSTLAAHLGVSQEIINAKPTAGLWPDQTDEGQFGFTYQEADHV